MLPSINHALPLAIRAAQFDAPPHAAVIYDLDAVDDRLKQLTSSFPSNTLHTLAVKACPFIALLRMAAARGFGAEAASAVELELARRAGFPADRIVFDSPVKTPDELRTALAQGIHVNADNLAELDRIAAQLAEAPPTPKLSIGIRINPEVGAGTIADTSTAAPGTKFGVSLHADGDALLDRFAAFPWLTGLHVHVGSQGCSFDLLAAGIERALHFADRVEQRCGANRIRTFDIGGGLPVSYRPDQRAPSFAEYAAHLHQRIPELFARDQSRRVHSPNDQSRRVHTPRSWRLVTEFGRAVWASTAFAATRVEYVKSAADRRVALIHLGGDLLSRAVYQPDTWSHEITVHDADGRPKSGAPVPHDIGGPLCFSGDLVARARPLPPIAAGDFVVIHDVGAYTYAAWSRYNSRQAPAVFGYRSNPPDLVLLKPTETIDDVLRFWGA